MGKPVNQLTWGQWKALKWSVDVLNAFESEGETEDLPRIKRELCDQFGLSEYTGEPTDG